MKIRTDFVSNSSSSAFVLYRVNNKHVCTKKELTDFIANELKSSENEDDRRTFMEAISMKDSEWFALQMRYMQMKRFKNYEEGEVYEQNLVKSNTVDELREKYLAMMKKRYGERLFKMLVDGMWSFTVVSKDEFRKIGGKRGYSEYKKFLSIESVRHYCCNSFDDETSEINRILDRLSDGGDGLDISYSLNSIRDMDEKLGRQLIKAYDQVFKISNDNKESVWDCFFFDETDYVVLFDENVIDFIGGMCEDGRDEILDDIKFVIRRAHDGERADFKKRSREVNKLMKKYENAKYTSPSYSISRIGEIIAERFGIKLRENRDNWITERDLISGCHHMG